MRREFLLSLAAVITVTRGLVALVFLALAVVGVSPEPVIQLLLVPVQAGAASGEAVHLAGVLHVSSLGVEVGHVPAILLVIVVVGVGAVVRRGDALSVRGGSSVIKVGGVTMSHLSAGA